MRQRLGAHQAEGFGAAAQMKGGDTSGYEVERDPEDAASGAIAFHNYHIKSDRDGGAKDIVVPAGTSVTYTAYRNGTARRSDWTISGPGITEFRTNTASIVFNRSPQNIGGWFALSIEASLTGEYIIQAHDTTQPLLEDAGEMTAVRVDFAVEPDGFPGCPNGLLFDNFSNTVFISVEGSANPSNLVFQFCAYPEENGQLINKAGTEIDFIPTDNPLLWRTSPTYWYGVLTDRWCYINLHNYTFLLNVNGCECVVSNRYCVNWPPGENPKMSPTVSDYSRTVINEPEPVPGITNFFRCLIEFEGFDKYTEIIGIPVLNQYAEETAKEEEFHAQQFHGTVPSNQGGQSDCFTAKGIKWMVGWVGEGPWYVYGTTPETTKEWAENYVKNGEKLEKDESWAIWMLDRGFVEMTAKAHAGYNAAFTYHCTYERFYGPTPTNHHHRAYAGGQP